MLSCDGYKMFHGTVKVTPTLGNPFSFSLTGTWLFKPDYGGYWYCKPDDGGLVTSWHPEVLSDFSEDGKSDAG